MKMRPGTQTGFLLCGKEWSEGEALEVRSPWDQGLVGRVTVATRADARQAVSHATASMRRTRALPRWKRREILEDIAAALLEQKDRFAQLIVAEAGNFPELLRFYREAVVDKGLGLFAFAIARGIARGEFRKLEPQHVARLCIAPLLFAVFWRSSFAAQDAVPYDLEGFIETHIDVLLKGLGPHEG